MALFARSPLQVFTWLGALTTVSCIVHFHPDADPGRLTAEQQAVQIYFKDQKLPCENYVELGNIEATSGEELEPDEKQLEYATFETALAWLKIHAHKRGASGVIVLDRKQSKDKTTYFVTGMAIRCVLSK